MIKVLYVTLQSTKVLNSNTNVRKLEQIQREGKKWG